MPPQEPVSPLGVRLRSTRLARGKSLRAVAEPAGISAAYLQKLETGLVESPSPHALHAIAETLATNYDDLMALAGYVVPRLEGGASEPALIAGNQRAERLSEQEAHELLDYLDFIRRRRDRASNG